ncbi:MAG TPA: hypothetical protein VD838_13805 [Anaeromyxobacteraceae bacterium]|nr:hypothetical protein [Anaeromyxobacteraceae bacterium]
MLVWRDLKGRHQALPAWLEGHEVVSRLHTEQGDLLACGAGAAELLGLRSGAAWHPVTDGWAVAVYGEVEPWRHERKLPWAIPVPIEDGRGVVWRVPAILSPMGTPACDLASRLTEDGWVEEPTTPIAARAIAAAQAALPFVREDRLHEVELARQNDWLCAVLEATYHLEALTIGRLGLITGTLRLHGLKAACGVIAAEAVRG